MLDTEDTSSIPAGEDNPGAQSAAEAGSEQTPAKKTAAKTAKKAPAKKAAAKKTPAKKTAAKRATAKKAAESPDTDPAEQPALGFDEPAAPAPAKRTTKKAAAEPAAKKTAAKKSAAKRTTKKAAVAAEAEAETPTPEENAAPSGPVVAPGVSAPLFQAPTTPARRRTRKAAASAPAETNVAESAPESAAPSAAEPATTPAAKRAARKSAAKKAAAGPDEVATDAAADAAATDEATPAQDSADEAAAPARKATRTRSRARKPVETAEAAAEESEEPTDEAVVSEAPAETAASTGPDDGDVTDSDDTDSDGDDSDDEQSEGSGGGTRRRRRRGGRRRRRSGGGGGGDNASDDNDDTDDNGDGDDNGADTPATQTGDTSGDTSGDSDQDSGDGSGEGGSGSGSRRRRRRRRSGEDADNGGSSDDPEKTVTRVRRQRTAEDEITSVSGSTRLEAKKQRRREGREAGRRRAPIVSEAEFLARRESVDRKMVIRQRKDLTQIAVLEDDVLVEHYVARESQTSLIGNIYLGRVQNVLPSMEAAFVDIGKGRNAVIYAGEVNWTALGAKDGPRKIESVLKSGQQVLVQVSKDPVGHKGARLTSQISLPGRFLVYVPDGTTSGISRKLPDTERTRLKNLLKEIVPDGAGVIVRTAAEGATEEELRRDVERLTARWEDIQSKIEKGNAPTLLYGEPDLTLKVVRDLFTEDFASLVVSGDEAWDLVSTYVDHVAPELMERVSRYDSNDGKDIFADLRIDEQIAKGLDRKVYLPSGGSLVIDRTEAMTVVDVNTGKFTGSGGNLEETVTKNNLEAAEEIVRQLRLRDIGGIIVIDFIDMVLESNRDLVLRRLVECLGRDRTRHQVAEVTSLGLVQMTRKRIGTGLLEAFSENCEHCSGRGLVLHDMPVEHKQKRDDEPRRARRGGGSGNGSGGSGGSGGGRNRGRDGDDASKPDNRPVPSPKVVAAMARPENAERALDAPDAAPPETVQSEAAPPETVQSEAAQSEAARPEVPAMETPQLGTTQTRTGRARAGRKATASVVTPEPEVTPEVSPEEPAAPAPQAPAEPVAEAESTIPTVSEPRLTSTVRRRGARRAAGPPPVVAAPEVDADAIAPVGAGESSASGDDETPVHVPVKRKGARKR